MSACVGSCSGKLLTKPFAPRELLTTVRSLLEMKDATADLVLAQQMDSLEVVAGGLAHEINNPLNYISNALRRVELDVAEVFKLAAAPADDTAARVAKLRGKPPANGVVVEAAA